MPASQRHAELLTDINRQGNLTEFGVDPLERLAGGGISLGVQTDSENKESTLLQNVASLDESKPKAHTAPSATSAAVLRVAVGLLGLEVHEKPHPWAEAWLTFQDVTAKKLGLSSLGEGQGPSYGGFDPPRGLAGKDNASAYSGAGKDGSTVVQDTSKRGQAEWQQRVLSHLRRLYDTGADEAVGPGGAVFGGNQALEGALSTFTSGGDSNFREQLDLSEFVLRRITHAVNVLQDPEKHDRPMVLQEYTEGMVLEVCTDLRQWLEQLATLLSLYHVHILDLEAERKKKATRLKDLEGKYAAAEADRKDAVNRYTVLHERWEEEKMKRRAEALLGIKTMGEDAKIYSQREVDEMLKAWEKEHVDPLMEEIKELRITRDELLAKLQGGKREKPKPGEPAEKEEHEGLGRKQLSLINACMGAFAERVDNGELSSLLVQTGDSIIRGGANLAEILDAIKKVAKGASEPVVVQKEQKQEVVEKKEVKKETKEKDGAVSQELVSCLSTVIQEMQGVEGGLRGAEGLDKIANWAKWARETLTTARDAKPGQQIRWKPAPKWDLKVPEKAPTKSQLVQTTAVATKPGETVVETVVQQAPVDTKDWQAEIDKIRKKLEAELAAALAEAEKQRLRAEEALRRLAEETARADKMLNELRKRLQEMERLLQKAGLGKEAADAIWDAGLADFMQGRDVFDRLYRDALRRMRSQAEAQARLLEETSASFMRVLHDLSLNPMSALDAAMELFTRQNDQLPRQPSPLQVMKLHSGAEAPSEKREASPVRPPRILLRDDHVKDDAVPDLMIISGLGAPPPGQSSSAGFGSTTSSGGNNSALARGRPRQASPSTSAAQSQGPAPPPMVAEAPLHCRGELVRAPAGHKTAAAADGVERSSSQGPAPRSRSPPSLQSPMRQAAPMGSYGFQDDHSILAINSVGPRAAPSRLLPPGHPSAAAGAANGQLMRGSPGKLSRNQGGSSRSSTPSQVLKSAGSMSMPQLSTVAPPRLLVQSVAPNF
mmetsp:Transcript_45208/g.81307  ORF Transcript_45208/g.81307 Transcript_45208/m.81307 type:complete len:1001 (+) Transcript_45208:30-3032(+)